MANGHRQMSEMICALLAYFGAAVTLKPVVWF